MSLEITTSDNDGWHIITVNGDVDLNSSPALRTAIIKGVEAKRKVAVNLNGAPYMDSSGVATLVEGLKTAKKGEFALIQPSSGVMRVLQLARLDSLFEIRDNTSGS